jgi:hypothetical protein
MSKEQRAYERRIPTGYVYAALGRDYERVGKLIDLSLGGLAFEYMSNGDQNGDYSQIDIFKVGEVFNLHKLPCQIVYDIPLFQVRGNIKSSKHPQNHRCGVEFNKITKESYDQLTLFLESHTVANIEK